MAELMFMPPAEPTATQRAQLDKARNRLQSRLLMAELEVRTAARDTSE